MMYFDSHTHLNNDQLYSHWQELLQQFADHGGCGLVNIGVDDVYNVRGIQIAQGSKKLFPQLQVGCTVGIHPCTVVENNMDKKMIDDMMVAIESDIKEYGDVIWGVGECGTDLYRPCTPQHHEMQQYATHCQAQLAQRYQLPLIIHSRSDRDGTYEVLKQYQDIVINLHCRNYTPDEIRIALETWGNRVYFGFGGIMTYPKAQEVRDSLLVTPLSQMVFETDAPYLPPQPHRGGENYPHYILETYRKASEVLNIDISVLCSQIENNWKQLYRRKL